MTISRRLFIGGLLAAVSGPAIIKHSDSLMKIFVPKNTLITGEFGTIDGIRFIRDPFKNIDPKKFKKFKENLSQDLYRTAFSRTGLFIPGTLIVSHPDYSADTLAALIGMPRS